MTPRTGCAEAWPSPLGTTSKPTVSRPTTTLPPSAGPLFGYLVDRLFDSFNLPFGPVRYLELMNPLLPDGETILSRFGLSPHGRVWRMIHEEWPKVRAEIDADHPSPLGLVKVRSADPFDLKENHQVLAYGYDLVEDHVTLHLYDPNSPGRDDMTLLLDPRMPAARPALTVSPHLSPVLAFFRVTYRSSAPP